MKYTPNRILAPLFVGALILATSSISHAGWGHLRGGGSSGIYAAAYGSSGYGSSGYGSSGYTAAYGSSGYASYGSSGYASYGSSGGWGLGDRIRAHFAAKRARHAARRAARHSYGSSGHYASSGYSAYSYGSSGGHGSSGGSSGYSSSYGSSGYSAPVSYGSSGGSTGYSSVGSNYYYGVSKNSTSAISSLASNVEGDEVFLTVAVPSEAKIFVNGKPTTSEGTVRQFVSRGLEPNKSYKFEVRAELRAADGETMTETKTVVASAGGMENLQFAFSDYDKAVETELVLNVPEGAEVELGGHSTKAIGTQRSYRTSQLAAGDVWDEYQVRVRFGDQVKSRTIRLIGGDQLQLTFDFDQETDKLASR